MRADLAASQWVLTRQEVIVRSQALELARHVIAHCARVKDLEQVHHFVLRMRHQRRRKNDQTSLNIAVGVEVRHAAFFAPAFRELLERHDVAFVISDGAGRWPMESFVTASFAYVRLHGSEELYASGYRPEELDRWAETCAALATRGLDVFVYFDNDAKVHAPADAEGLMRRLGIAMPAHPLSPSDRSASRLRRSFGSRR